MPADGNAADAALVVAALIGVITTGSAVTRAIPTTVGPASPATSKPPSKSSVGVSAGEITRRQPVATVPAQPATMSEHSAVVAPTSASAVATPVRSIQAISMFDTTHGFAVVGVCDSDGPACIPSFRATSNGLEWIEHRLPRVGRTQDGASSPTLTALGPRAVYYEMQADDTQTPTGFFSADSGTTWTPVAVGVNGTTQTIPAAAEVRATCPPGGTDPCDTIALTARSPSDGRLLKLAHQPTWCRSR